MQEKTAHIVAQYVRDVYAKAYVRPYENKHPLANGISGSLRFEQLAEAGHWRVELGFAVQGHNTEGVLCFEAGSTIEAIALLQGIEPDEVETVLTHTIASLLVGNLRTAIATASQSTGYGPVTLPPLLAQQLDSIAQSSRTQ